MVAKLSSVSTISAACFATSVPVCPMAIPTSAAFKEGASLTPSPVMATMLPFSFSARTIRTLWSGETREKTAAVSARSLRAASSIRSSSAPLMHWVPSSAIPSRLAMARAVSLWSPVIITVRTWALLNMATAWAASGRGGSAMAARPRKTMSSSFLPSPSLLAAPSTRSPCPESHEIRSWSLLLLLPVRGRSPPPDRYRLHRSRITSGAPFV